MPVDACVDCSLKEGFIVGGILLGYLASALWVGDTGGWRYMYGAALPPALIVFAGMVSPSSELLPLLRLFFLSLFFFFLCTPSSSSSHGVIVCSLSAC